MTTKEERREWVFKTYTVSYEDYCNSYHSILRELSAYVLSGDKDYGFVVQSHQLADFVMKFLQKRFNVYADYRSCWSGTEGAWNVYVLNPTSLGHRSRSRQATTYNKRYVRWVDYRVQKEKKHGVQVLPE